MEPMAIRRHYPWVPSMGVMCVAVVLNSTVHRTHVDAVCVRMTSGHLHYDFTLKTVQNSVLRSHPFQLGDAVL